MSERTRRFFWGNSLPQAVMSAARYHRLDPEQVDYSRYEKRHGFLKHPRNVVIVVDPAAPRRPEGARRAAPAAAKSDAAPAAPRPRPARPERPTAGPEPRERPARPARGPERGGGPVSQEAWDAPDGEAQAAAGEATRRLVKLAALELQAEVAIAEDRLEVTLTGPDEGAASALGIPFLEELEHLLPRAIHGLCGRMVRCRIECGGLRAAHDGELRELAQRTAERVRESGEPVLLDPLSAAERRVVHMALRDVPGVTTESVGTGTRKRVQIAPSTGG